MNATHHACPYLPAPASRTSIASTSSGCRGGLWLWINRKRADQSYKDYLLRVDEVIADVDARRLATRLQHDVKEALIGKKKKIIRDKMSHFDFIERVAGYHLAHL